MQPVIVGEIGSTAHGLGTPESDHDYIGLYLDPPESLIGHKPEQGAVRDRDKPEGIKSEAGDSEVTYYGLRKYIRLVTDGNPTVMTLLFTPVLKVADKIGLQKVRDMFLSRKLAARHIGYADSMYARLTGQRAPRTNRPELIAKHGYDTKAAFHALRLLIQGHEMLTKQTMTMPMVDRERNYLLDIRHGRVPEAEVLGAIDHYRDQLVAAEGKSPLPPEPDYAKINGWLITAHAQHWSGEST
ncbi:Predicted nucleotidyltransferase [Mycobacteroides abscessus subsp. abscessus]|uniref:nucleotidyltransferase domain-containing protein n=1 Tax=Mycobacteroides abscessus TaxID=36809 RepID=UPI00092654F3|nr:nucleotidyltransferase domain-containing protein [Mycobacteroides abscessus]SIL71198.1 Predicted nucleotidyltransferase [Mycobacteroides abscessus subsp. abscessus]